MAEMPRLQMHHAHSNGAFTNLVDMNLQSSTNDQNR